MKKKHKFKVKFLGRKAYDVGVRGNAVKKKIRNWRLTIILCGERVGNKEVDIRFVHSRDRVADGFTKALGTCI